MKKIVAIGGGEIGRPGFPVETTRIDKEIMDITGKKHPRLLFVPTASSDAELYSQTVKKHFGRKLGCKVDVLYLLNNHHTQKEIKDKVFRSDIIYVGGGNTLKMMRIWRKTGVDKILKQAHQAGVVLAGVSAGSICWFKWGSSDSRKFTNPQADLIKVAGLGLINALNCPHYDVEKNRKRELRKMMKKTTGIAVALDNCCAMEIIDDRYRIISSKPSANAYKVYWKASRYHQEEIHKDKKYRPLKDLLRK